MKTLRLRPRRWPRLPIALLLALAGALLLLAQGDMTGYWAFRVKDGGVSFLQFQQTGDTVTSVAPAGRGSRDDRSPESGG